MKFNIEDIQLSGKGFISSQEFSHENIKLMLDATQFFEVVSGGEEPRRLGWLVPNSFTLLADFMAHTKDGARGESTEDAVEAALVLDYDSYLTELVPESLMDLDTAEAQQLLETMLTDGEKTMKGKVNIEEFTEGEKGLLVISPRSNLVFVQADDASIRVAKEGVYVLKRGKDDEYDKLIMVDSDRGVNIMGDKSISVGPGGIVIDGKDFNPEEIVRNVTKSLEGTLKGIGPMMAGLAGMASMGSMGSMGANFGNFANFGNMGDEITRKVNKKINKAMKKLGKMNFGEGKFNFNFDFDDVFDGDFDFDFDGEEFESDMHEWAEDFRESMQGVGDEIRRAMKGVQKDLKKEFKKEFTWTGSFSDDDDVDTDFSDAHDIDVDF
ncbi:MAG: hypothetical protein ACXAE3_09415 [Candidatus Kariarchaeaceae archaeon]|jgi:hypothetical protein